LPTSSLGGSDVEVVNTGADLDLNTSNTQNTVVGATNTNVFNGQQTAIGISNTGLNGAFGNVGGGSVQSGDAVVTTDLSVEANSNENVFDLSGLGNGSGNGSFDLINTGADADINASSTQTTVIGVQNMNSANVGQFSLGLANSGLNFTGGNVGGGGIASGNAGVANDFSVLANTNQTGIALGNLGGVGSEDFSTVNTGSGLDLN